MRYENGAEIMDYLHPQKNGNKSLGSRTADAVDLRSVTLYGFKSHTRDQNARVAEC